MPGERLLNLTDMNRPVRGYHCCHQMTEQVAYRCPDHPDPFDCPDSLVFYSPVFDEYGLIVHDRSSTYIHITHCPWCGVRLPEPKRDLWFDTLKKMGYRDPLDQQIPEEFLTDAWHGK